MSFILSKRLLSSRKNKLLDGFSKAVLILSRNCADIPFPPSKYFSPFWEEEVKKRVEEVYSSLARGGFSWLELGSHSEKIKSLSWFFPQLLYDSSGKILIHKGNLGALINYQDHLSLFLEGEHYNLESYWKRLSKWDDFWESHLPYAYSEQWGYLTSSPSRLGTGFKIYMRMHLPALSFLYGERKLLQWFKDNDKVVVEAYGGEDEQILAHLFIVSNLFTLGVKEKEVLKTMQDFGKGIWKWERQARVSLVKSSPRQNIFWQMVENLYQELIEENGEGDEKKFLDFISFWLLAQEEGILPESQGFQFVKANDLGNKAISRGSLRGQALKILGFLGIDLGRIFSDV